MKKPMTRLWKCSVFALLLQNLSSKTIRLKAKLFRQSGEIKNNLQKVFVPTELRK